MILYVVRSDKRVERFCRNYAAITPFAVNCGVVVKYIIENVLVITALVFSVVTVILFGLSMSEVRNSCGWGGSVTAVVAILAVVELVSAAEVSGDC